MPTTTDRSAIRAILSNDRQWSAYALGDLSPDFFEQCEWHVPAGANDALVMIFRGLEPPILFTYGDVPSIQRLLEEIEDLPTVSLHVRPDVVGIVRARYQQCHIQTMWRMALSTSHYRPTPTGQAVRLGLNDLAALRRLYSDGEANGESPDFFVPSMLSRGIYFGIYESEGMVAAAGTHLITPEEGVGAVGNVYTRRDRRGLGHAGAVTSAVTNELLRIKLSTIILSVNQGNAPAIRVYERLGYTRYCSFCEGVLRNPRHSV